MNRTGTMSRKDFRSLQRLVDAAYGLSFGEDWNNGNAAKRRGYRKKLLSAIPAARKAIRDNSPAEEPRP